MALQVSYDKITAIMTDNDDSVGTSNSFPAYYSKWGKMGPGFRYKGTISITNNKIELTSEKEGLKFSLQPSEIKVTVPYSYSFQVVTPNGTYVIYPGKSALAGSKFAGLSKEVRLMTKNLLRSLDKVGIDLPKEFTKLVS